MATQNLSTLFGSAGSSSAAGTNSSGAWNRPLHETQCQWVVYPGGQCSFCVPSNATRVVIEMWGQGGGGAGACCCTWGSTGGQAGSYAYKVWSNAAGNSPAARGSYMCLCGCVCACDCQSYDTNGSYGQFSRVYDCTGYWYGCVCGGQPGNAYCTATCWWSNGAGYNCNVRWDACCAMLPASSGSTSGCYAFPASESNGNIVGPSCICGGSYICVGASGINNPIGFTTAGGVCPSTAAPSSGFTANTAQIDCVWQYCGCSCFDFLRVGACGFTNLTNASFGSAAGSCDAKIGVGGAAYAGGAQQQRSSNPSTFYYCGFPGNFPGGGGRSAGAFGGGCCAGGYGGGGLILVSYKI